MKGEGMRLVATFENVVVKRDEAQKKSDGGIILPDSTKDKATTGTVVSAGPSCRELAPGTRILIPAYGGHEITLNGRTLVVLGEDEVQAVVNQQ